MPTVISGLPAHVLLVHVVVVLVPLGALLTASGALWPAAQRRIGLVGPLTCLAALVAVPLTTHAGEWLRTRLRAVRGGTDPAIERHAHLGRELLPYVAGLLVVSVVVWWLGRRRASVPSAPKARVTVPVAAVAVAVAAVTVWQCYRVGDSGSRAVWQGVAAAG